MSSKSKPDCPPGTRPLKKPVKENGRVRYCTKPRKGGKRKNSGTSKPECPPGTRPLKKPVKENGRVRYCTKPRKGGKSRSQSKSKRQSKSKTNKCDGVICKGRRVCLEATGTCVMPCLEHQVRDPITNRCRNKEGYKRERAKPGEFKPCPPHQYRDPETNRCKNKPGFKRERPKKTSPRPKYKEKSRWEDTKEDKRDCVHRSKLPLRDHQKKVVRYMKDHRGLLVVHGTGTGKTLTAATISQCYLDDNPGKRVVFVGPASLESNFVKELRNYGVSMKNIARHYKFYSFEKFLSNTKRRVMNKVSSDKDRDKIGWPLNPISFKNSLLIVDEAHNVRNPMTATARALQESAFTADKVVLLTATPFVNNMRDYIPLINMIYGRYIVGTYKEFQTGTVPDYLGKSKVPSKEDLQTFRALLRDKVDVVSKKEQKDFPKRKDIMRYVKMTPSYLEAYTKLMDREKVAGLFFKNPERFYNGYRRAVNMAGPEYFSSKVEKAIPYLEKGKALLYSNWLEFGVNPISRALTKAGITFEKYTGKTSKNKREEIISDFNNGEFQVLIVSSAGGEGLDLKGVRSVVVLDPPWNDASLEQVIGRAVRYKSHSHLPEKDRVVNVYLMALVDPRVDINNLRKEVDEEDIPTQDIVKSGDLLLYDIIRRKRKSEQILFKQLQKLSITR